MRYVIAGTPGGLWGHIFDNAEGEVMTQFVYDTQERKLVAAKIVGGQSEGGPWWTDASPVMVADLEDSLVNANEDALDNPGDWGLAVSDELPDWASESARPSVAAR